MTAPVLTELLPTANGRQIGLITLNSEKTLNAQSTKMIRIISPALSRWVENDDVVMVLVRGAGDKAFCAGGDIRNLYHIISAEPAFPNPDVLTFFREEYGLCYQMHTYPKPILTWSSGIVMGGGMGLNAAASHRIVTETTLMAMPEISIGLFPDAGGSWFLQRMPAKSGLFFGLTGMRFNGRDAMLANLADYAMPADGWPQLLDALHHAPWAGISDNHHILNATLNRLHQPNRLPESQLLPNLEAVHNILNAGDIHAVDAVLRHTEFTDPWLTQAADTYRNGCPVTAALTWRIYERVRNMSLAGALHMELIVAMHCCNNGDFREGVRALLIDKDRSPNWSRTLAEVSPAYIDSHFINPFAPGEHPFDHWFQAGNPISSPSNQGA